MTYKTFFGDGEKTFALTHPMILELERKTGQGIGSLFYRVRSNAFNFTDILETVRLGLIGGGSTPFDADALIATYGVNRPIAETLKIAVELLSILFFGADEQPGQVVAE